LAHGVACHEEIVGGVAEALSAARTRPRAGDSCQSGAEGFQGKREREGESGLRKRKYWQIGARGFGVRAQRTRGGEGCACCEGGGCPAFSDPPRRTFTPIRAFLARKIQRSIRCKRYEEKRQGEDDACSLVSSRHSMRKGGELWGEGGVGAVRRRPGKEGKAVVVVCTTLRRV